MRGCTSSWYRNLEQNFANAEFAIPDGITSICIIGGGPASIQLASLIDAETNHTFKIFEKHNKDSFFLNTYKKNASLWNLNSVNSNMVPDQHSLITSNYTLKDFKSFLSTDSNTIYPQTKYFIEYLKYFRDNTIDQSGKQGKIFFESKVFSIFAKNIGFQP